MNAADGYAPKQVDPGPMTRQITAVSSKRTRKSSLDQNQAGRAGEPPATKNASPLAYAGDCDEKVGGGSTFLCENHNARARERRKKHKGKKRAEAKAE